MNIRNNDSKLDARRKVKKKNLFKKQKTESWIIGLLSYTTTQTHRWYIKAKTNTQEKVTDNVLQRVN